MPADDTPNLQPAEHEHDDIPEVYELETLEQLRAIADELRSRIAEALVHRAMTVTQLGEMLGQAPAKIHYHVRELERVGLIRLVATREKSGILEKYYRAVARSLTASKTLLLNVPSDESLATMRAFLDSVSRGFMRATEYTIRNQQWENPKVWGLNSTQIWITYEEMKALARRVQQEFDKYATPRGIEGEEERTIIMMGYDPRVAGESAAESLSPTPPEPPAPPIPPNAPTPPSPTQSVARQSPDTPPSKNGSRRVQSRHMVVAGVVMLRRSDLEEAIAQHRQLDISAIGVCTFADDITPELIDQAIGHFRHRGVLTASAEVREALKRKE
jgi:DNA-binding transcriptional ArsR family regulator